MPIQNDLLEILACPETRQCVAPAPPETLARVNADIEAGRLRTRGGEPLSGPIEEALVREDGRVLFRIDDGIPIMLIDQSIELDRNARDR